MSHSFELKTKAELLRKKGFSLKEISDNLKISKSTASIWLSSIELSKKAQDRLEKNRILGPYKAMLIKKKFREEQKELAFGKAYDEIKNIPISRELFKLYSALLWWCEGNKETSYIRFTNSDPTMIQNFLYVLRSGFNLDESKFRGLLHLHQYHDEKTQQEYWSNITNIPLRQFNSSFRKANTGKRKKLGYPGCIAICYYDAKIAKELEAIYNAFTLNRGVR
ncbi:MAG: hypothetical protein HY344_03690 [Candidatus Levybacteria bacterium]|nr:hypothetical protein [Candidatus Levybacteria bacterium]